jgi:hypothetical protein
MRMTLGQKANRVLQFLLGLRVHSIATALAAHGFGEADLSRGWELLRGLSVGRLGVPSGTATDPTLVTNLDAWENKWFPIASATLASNHAAAHEAVFRNLAQTSGPEVIVTVGILLDRIDALPKAKDQGGLGTDGAAARALLTKRGLTADVMDEARAILAQAAAVETAEEERVEAASDPQSEDAMWRWYLEWSQIARAVLTDRRELRALGFLRRTESGEDVEVPEPTPEPVVTPPA